MLILGIETSCDETAAAVIEDGRIIRSSVIASSLKEHARFGGVIPEIASRRQLDYIQPVVEQALNEATVSLSDLDAIAVTVRPGLIGSLLVGTSFARALSYTLGKPLIEIDHVQAHLYANFLRKPDQDTPVPKLPAIGLVVSGGHTSLFHVPDHSTFELIGRTRDDAVGEAFDKVARILELGYPGGPAIDRMAQQGGKSAIRFTCASMPNSLDFSFSGIKTAVLYHTQKKSDGAIYRKEDVAYAFQGSVVEILVEKCRQACRDKGITTLLVGGGVAANSALRSQLAAMAQAEAIQVHIPSLPLCMDNAAMIAGLAYHRSS